MSDRVIYSVSSELSVREKVEGILSSMGGMSNFVKPGNLVLIKPNFVAPFPHATTSLEVLEFIVRAVKRCGGKPVIAESSGYEFDTEATFRILGVREFAKRTGTDLINLDTSQFERVRIQNSVFGEVWIPKLVRQADVLINVPKLKRHGITDVTAGMKNLIGFLHRKSRRKIHCFGLNRAIVELGRFIPCDLVLVDGLTVVDRAVYGAHRRMNLLLGSKDIYAADIFCCRLLDIDYRGVGHIRIALERGHAKIDCQEVSLDGEETERPWADRFQREKASLKKSALRQGYRLMYFLETAYALGSGGRSIVPKLHYYLGIRPRLDPGRCNGCGVCAGVCPVDAIQVSRRRINPSLCMRVRCLKCIAACPESAIRIRGREVDGMLLQQENGAEEERI